MSSEHGYAATPLEIRHYLRDPSKADGIERIALATKQTRASADALPSYLRDVASQFGYPAAMPVSSDYLQYVLEQLTRLPGVTSRRMFGGVGLYSDGVFFGIIDNDTVFFKVDDSTRESYTSRGSEPFRPYKDRPEVSMSYFQVPADVLEDADELVPWARTAVRAAAASAQTKRTPKRASSKRAGRKTPPRA